jgi:Ca2+/Na+ antiporter
MGLAIGVILLLIFISWMNTNDCWALGLTTFFVCFVLMFIGVWLQMKEEQKKKRGW